MKATGTQPSSPMAASVRVRVQSVARETSYPSARVLLRSCLPVAFPLVPLPNVKFCRRTRSTPRRRRARRWDVPEITSAHQPVGRLRGEEVLAGVFQVLGPFAGARIVQPLRQPRPSAPCFSLRSAAMGRGPRLDARRCRAQLDDQLPPAQAELPRRVHPHADVRTHRADRGTPSACQSSSGRRSTGSTSR